MQQQLLNLWRNMEAHLRIVIFAVFGALVVAVFAVSAMEAGETAPALAGGSSVKPPDIEVEDPAAARIQEGLYGQKPPIGATSYASLITNSMFDVKAIQNAVALDQQANKRYEDAFRLYSEKKYREALDACNEALAIRSSHFPAQQLKVTLEGKLREAGILRGESTAPQSVPGAPTPIAPGAAPTPVAP